MLQKTLHMHAHVDGFCSFKVGKCVLSLLWSCTFHSANFVSNDFTFASMTFKSWLCPCCFLLNLERCLLISTVNMRNRATIGYHWVQQQDYFPVYLWVDRIHFVANNSVLACHCDSSSEPRNSKQGYGNPHSNLPAICLIGCYSCLSLWLNWCSWSLLTSHYGAEMTLHISFVNGWCNDIQISHLQQDCDESFLF